MARKRQTRTSSTRSERRRKHRIRWVLGIWAGLLLIAAIAYAIKKQLGATSGLYRRSQPTAMP